MTIAANIDTNSTRALLTVSELNKRAKTLLENELPSLQVCGELSSVSKPASGHWYFTLKDDRAQIRCAMFASANKRCKISPIQGMEIIVTGKVSIYEGRGDFQMIIESMNPSGIGALHKAYEQLKQKLFNEGLFEANNKLPLPTLPTRVAIITSATGAAIADMVHVFQRRAPNVDIVLFPAIVQGEQAVDSMLTMLNHVESRGIDTKSRPCDLVIIGRGGGSLEDLWPFNDERLARKLANYSLPTISAVGHEIDHSISDYAASASAATPSVAAEIATQHWVKLADSFSQQSQLLYQKQRLLIQAKQQQLQQLQKSLINPNQQLREQIQRLDYLSIRLDSSIQRRVQQYQQQLLQSQSVLDAIAPQRLLDRGYSILLNHENKPITSTKALSKGQRVHSQLKDGQIALNVISINTNNPTIKK